MHTKKGAAISPVREASICKLQFRKDIEACPCETFIGIWKPDCRVLNAAIRLELPTPVSNAAIYMAHAGTNNLVRRFVEAGLLTELPGRARNRRFRYGAFIDLFADI